MIQRGHIVVCSFPFSDFSNVKLRPALVISNRTINVSEDVVVMAVSTQQQEHIKGVKIVQHDLVAGSLVQESFIHCHKIHLLNKTLIYKVVAKANARLLKSIEKKFQVFISAS